MGMGILLTLGPKQMVGVLEKISWDFHSQQSLECTENGGENKKTMAIKTQIGGSLWAETHNPFTIHTHTYTRFFISNLTDPSCTSFNSQICGDALKTMAQFPVRGLADYRLRTDGSCGYVSAAWEHR